MVNFKEDIAKGRESIQMLLLKTGLFYNVGICGKSVKMEGTKFFSFARKPGADTQLKKKKNWIRR